MSMRGDPWVPFHKRTRGSPFINKCTGAPQNPGALTNELR